MKSASHSNSIFIRGAGAVSPAGWGMAALREALVRGEPLPVKNLSRPGWVRPLRTRQVQMPPRRLPFMAQARLRRCSPIAHYVAGAAIEALGDEAAKCQDATFRLGCVFCTMSGCVNYSRRFYGELLNDPSTASPLVFPETVYNSPASHLAAFLGTSAINYTLVGDPGTFLQGVALAADWLERDKVDGCLVIGAEETDWLTSDAMRLFVREVIVSDGAGALYLTRETDQTPAVRLGSITNPRLYSRTAKRLEAGRAMRAECPEETGNRLLCDGLLGFSRADHDEQAVWGDWVGPRLSPKAILGEGLMAGAAWQCVSAVDALQQNRYAAATVSVMGCNQQAIAGQFVIA